MAQRYHHDWEMIEREYRAGQLSISEIARIYGLSRSTLHKKAKDEGWSRDLSDQVRHEVAARLLSDTGDGLSNAPYRAVAQEAAIDTAARRGVMVVREHRALIAELITEVRAVNTILMAGGHTDRDGTFTPLTPRERTDYLRVAAQAAHRLIPLERQAFSLDEPGAMDGPNSIMIGSIRARSSYPPTLAAGWPSL